MKLTRVHPLSSVSFTALFAAFVLPFTSFGLRFSAGGLLAVALLASAFAVLSVGHFLVERAWSHQLALALANVSLLLGWWFSAVAMLYFAPGLSGAAAFGAALCIPTVLLVFAVVRKRSAASHAT